MYSLGPLAVALEDLGSVSEALGIIEGLLDKDELTQSFLQWRPSAEMYRFDNKESLQMDDFDLVMNLVHAKADDSEWVDTRYGYPHTVVITCLCRLLTDMNRLTPKLKQCADRSLLYKLLDSLFQKKESGSLAGADVIAGRILEATLPKLKLTIDDFTSSAVKDGPYSSTSSSSWNYASSVVANFVKFLDIFLKYNFTDLATRLLEQSCADVAEAFRAAPPKRAHNMAPTSSSSRSWRYGASSSSSTDAKRIEDMPTEFASKVLECLIDAAQKHQLPLPLAPLKDLFEVLVRKYLLFDAPTQYPPPPVGWTHKPRRCGDQYRTNSCPHCAELNQFLLASDQAQARFQRPATFRTHVERQLPKEFFRCESGPSPNGGCYTLVVTKLKTEYQDDVDQFLNKVARIDERVRFFSTTAREYVEELLGDNLFRELVLLEKIRQPPPTPTPTPASTSAPTPTPTFTPMQAGGGGGGGGPQPPQGGAPALAPPAAPTRTLPTPPGYAIPAVPGSGSNMRTNMQIPAPIGPRGPDAYLPLPYPAPPQNNNRPPPALGSYGMMMMAGQTTATTTHYPSYPPVSLPPIHHHHHHQQPQNGPSSAAAAQPQFVLPPLQPVTGNAGLLKRRAGGDGDGAWERPGSAKALKSLGFVDLTDD